MRNDILETRRRHVEELNYLGIIGLLMSYIFNCILAHDVLLLQKVFNGMLMSMGSGGKLNGLIDAAQNYHAVLAENRRLYNEIQDLKGICS